MNSEETLKAVIDKYKLSEQMPPEVRASMARHRKEGLVNILGKDSKNTLLISAVVSFFLWIKKFGISISITKSTAIVVTAIAVAAGTVTVTGVYTAKVIIRHIHEEKQSTHAAPDNNIGIPVIRVAAAPRGVMSYDLAVSTIEMDNASGNKLSALSEKIIASLREKSGEKAAISFAQIDRYHIADRILSISIKKTEDKSGESALYSISVKIVRSSDSMVVTHSSVTVEDEDSIPAALETIAEKISTGTLKTKEKQQYKYPDHPLTF